MCDRFDGKGDLFKIQFVTGSHGMDNGQDGLNSVKCLSASDGYFDKHGQSQTKMFYEEQCRFFGLSMEGEDPRDYDPVTGIVRGLIKRVTLPD